MSTSTAIRVPVEADLAQVKRKLYLFVALCVLGTLVWLVEYAHKQNVNLEGFPALLLHLLQAGEGTLLAGWGGRWLPVLLFLAQAGVIGYVVLFRPKVRIAGSYAIATAAVEQFYFWWKFLWASWLALYLGMAALAATGHWGGKETASSWSLAITPLLNLATLAMGALYLSMTSSTIPAAASSSPARLSSGVGSPGGTAGARSLLASLFALPQGRAGTGVWVIRAGLTRFLLGGGVALVLFSVLEVACAWWDAGYLVAFKWVAGIVGGLAFVLFVSRLDSKPLDNPFRVLVWLYLYAVIQPGVAAFDSAFGWLVLTNVALCLKCLLFLHVSRQLENGAMFYYMYIVREFIDQGDLMRQQFITAAEATKAATETSATWQRAVVESIGREEARCRVTIHGMDFPISLPATVLQQHRLEPNMDFELRLGTDGQVSVDDVKPLLAREAAVEGKDLVLRELKMAIESDFWNKPPRSTLPWKGS